MMKARLLLVVVMFVLLSVHGAFAGDSEVPKICLNSVGFLPEMPKRASIAAKCSGFTVKRASDDEVVFSGKASGPTNQRDVKQDVWTADFSKLTQSGKFYLEVADVGRSCDFEIKDDVYNDAFHVATRAMYLARCGTAVACEYQGDKFAHAACHMEDAYEDFVGRADSKRDGTGGWHDTGNYNKYALNTAFTLGTLSMAWDHFGERLNDVSLDIPDTAPGYPDFLKELKWGTDWLLKMQYPDGSGKISSKLSRLQYEDFVMPEADKERRFYSDWSSAATADFVAVMAMAARHFEPYEPDYAQKCLTAARNSYKFLKANPANKEPNQWAFSTEGYVSVDRDDRMWAAVELWETTGEAGYLDDFQRRADDIRAKVDASWDWDNVRNFAMITYALSEREKRAPSILEDARGDIIATADAIVAVRDRDVYGRPLGGKYARGSNGLLARQAVVLHAADRLSPNPEYARTILDAVGHIFGRNYYGRSFVTGLGHKPPMHPHDRRSGSDKVASPWPGYLMAGGEAATDWEDAQGRYYVNESNISWQAALIYALAGFVDAPSE